jgi:hypothetical protein
MADERAVQVIASAHDRAFDEKHHGCDSIIRLVHRDIARLSVAALEAAGYRLVPPAVEPVAVERRSDG